MGTSSLLSRPCSLLSLRQSPERITAQCGVSYRPHLSVCHSRPSTDWFQSSLYYSCLNNMLLSLPVASTHLVFFFFFFLPVCFNLDFSILPDVVWILCKEVPQVRETDRSLFRDRGCTSPLAESTHPSDFSHFPFPENALCQYGNSGI